MRQSVYHLLTKVMLGETRLKPVERFSRSVSSCVLGHSCFHEFMEACSRRYGQSHTLITLEEEIQELLLTDLNPTTQTVRFLSYQPNVVFGYGIYQNLPHLHPGFSTEIHRWIRHSSLSKQNGYSLGNSLSTSPEVDQPPHAREAISTLLTSVVSAVNHRTGAPKPSTLTEIAQLLGVHYSASAQVAVALENQHATDLNGICRLLGVSSRTLQRRLKEEHTSFEQLRSAARMTQAMKAMQTGLNLTEVAHAVGYTDSAHFSHSFKHACGMPPSIAKLLLSGPLLPEGPRRQESPLQIGA